MNHLAGRRAQGNGADLAPPRSDHHVGVRAPRQQVGEIRHRVGAVGVDDGDPGMARRADAALDGGAIAARAVVMDEAHAGDPARLFDRRELGRGRAVVDQHDLPGVGGGSQEGGQFADDGQRRFALVERRYDE